MLKHFMLSFGITVLCISIAAVAAFRVFAFAPDNTYDIPAYKAFGAAKETIAEPVGGDAFDTLHEYGVDSNEASLPYGYLQLDIVEYTSSNVCTLYAYDCYMLLLYDGYVYDEYEYIEEPIAPMRPMVALTFDDGPSSSTRRILDTLEEHNAHATFFVLGRNLERNRDTALRIFESGNELANHTFTHQALVSTMTREQIIHEIQSTSAAIEEITGVPAAPMFRPPGGSRSNRLTDISYEIGYAIVLWDIDPNDWLYRDPCHIYNHIMSNVRDGSIIVLHDTHFTTAMAMERVVPALINRGFDLVTVSELIYRSHGRGLMAGQIYISGR